MHRLFPFGLLFVVSTARAAAPDIVPITGYLTDDAGVPIDGAVDLGMTLYDRNGGPVWEDEIATTVDQGRFTVYLGEGSAALDLSLFRDESVLYLGVSVDGDPEMTPRFEIATAPWAAYAQYCDTAASVGAIAEADIVTTSSTVGWGQIADAPSGLADGDDDTKYSASGAGLALTGTAFSLDRPAIEGWATGVCYDTATELLTALGDSFVEDPGCAADDLLVADGLGDYVCKDPDAAAADLRADIDANAAQLASLQTTVTTLQGTAIVRGDGSTKANAAQSCLELKENFPTKASGMYWIDPDEGSNNNAWQAYCDMTYLGGGWTLVGVDVYGDTGNGRLKSGTPVQGEVVWTCNTVNRSWTTSCWHASRHLLTGDTELLVKAGKDLAGNQSFDTQLAYARAKFTYVHPDTVWYMIVGNHYWHNNGAQIWNYQASRWDGLPDPGGNCNHHSKWYTGSPGWIHWNTADTARCGGSQSAGWGRNDIANAYVDPTAGNPVNRFTNEAGMMLEIYIRGS